MTAPKAGEGGGFIIPSVTVGDDTKRHVVDIESGMLEEGRTIILNGVAEGSARVVIDQLIWLNMLDPNAPIHMYIDSYGGSVDDGLAIYDTMKYINAPVYTYSMGKAMSMGAFLLAAGDKRFATPHSRIMIHELSGGMEGRMSSMRNQYHETERLEEVLARILAHSTGQRYAKIVRDIEKLDHYLTADEAKDYGIIDEVLAYSKNVEKRAGLDAVPAAQPRAQMRRVRGGADVVAQRQARAAASRSAGGKSASGAQAKESKGTGAELK